MLDGSTQVVEAGQIECTEIDWRTINRKLKRIAKRRRALDREEAEWLLKAERARVHTRFDCGSFFEYLERVLGYTPKTAIDRLRVAHALEDHPALGKAGLPFTALREIARVVTAENVDEWVKSCRGKTVHEIEKLVSGLKKGDDPGAPRGPQNHVVRMELTPSSHALFREVQRELADETGGAVDDSAVIEAMSRAYLNRSEGARKTPAYQISITTCDECGRSYQDGGGVTVEVSPAVRDQAECDASHVGRLDAPAPTPPTVDIPAATRNLVWRRDHGRCKAPGCRAKRNLEIHHIKHREHGGTHDAENLILICAGHHAAHHAGTLVISGTGSKPCFAALRTPTPPPAKTVDDDVEKYLVHMDFSPKEAREATARARPHVDAHPSAEALLRAALRELSPFARHAPDARA